MRQPSVTEGAREGYPQDYGYPGGAAPTSGRSVFLEVLHAYLPSPSKWPQYGTAMVFIRERRGTQNRLLRTDF